MVRRGLLLALTLFLASVLLVLALPVHGDRLSTGPQQTWPSRTPTSAAQPPEPTVLPPDGGGGSEPTRIATETIGGTATSSSPSETTIAVTVIATEPGRSVATAQPCQVPPTVRALGLVTSRVGPGLEYAANGILTFSEVRPIVGRAAQARWWLIQLTSTSHAWVSDEAISVQGFIGSVPIVDAPAINGETATPGISWDPTPNPNCTPEAATLPVYSTATISSQDDTVELVSLTPTSKLAGQEVEPPADSAESPVGDDTNIPVTEIPAEANLDAGSPGFNLDFILGLGIVFLLAGGVLIIVQRRGG